MSYSVKDELENLIHAAQLAGKHEGNDRLVKTMIRAKGVIRTLENRLADTLSVRDTVALQMLPYATQSSSDAGQVMGHAFELADLFLEARKEVTP